MDSRDSDTFYPTVTDGIDPHSELTVLHIFEIVTDLRYLLVIYKEKRWEEDTTEAKHSLCPFPVLLNIRPYFLGYSFVIYLLYKPLHFDIQSLSLKTLSFKEFKNEFWSLTNPGYTTLKTNYLHRLQRVQISKFPSHTNPT